jgi:hypothetical protein
MELNVRGCHAIYMWGIGRPLSFRAELSQPRTGVAKCDLNVMPGYILIIGELNVSIITPAQNNRSRGIHSEPSATGWAVQDCK